MSDTPTPGPALEPALSPTLNPALNEALDIQHDPFPAQEEGDSRRTPHLGHTLLFFALTATVFLGCLLLVAVLFQGKLHGKVQAGGGLDTALSLGVEGATYVLTLLAAWYVFPPLWKRSFPLGIHWNGLAARRYWPRLVAAGILISALAQAAEHLVTEPKSPEIERLMHTPAGAWSVMLLGTLLAPVMEEIAFRGFLLPSLAIAYDWLSLERTPAALRRWASTSGNSAPALVFAAVFSSLVFALIHAPQLDYTWGPVALLFGVSLLFSYIRIRTHSVACSTVVHLTYNLTIFVAALIATGGFRHLDRL